MFLIADITLTIEHERRIRLVLMNARDKWSFIGEEIGCKSADLEEIGNRYHPNQTMCLHEMLKSRISQGGLTRSILCASLRGPCVERDDLAQNIERLSFD